MNIPVEPDMAIKPDYYGETAPQYSLTQNPILL